VLLVRRPRDDELGLAGAEAQLDRARRELEARLVKAPDNVPMLVELGWIELSARRIDASRSAFERALEHAPNLEDARVGSIAGDVAAHDLENARERVNSWLRKDAHDPVAQTLAARLDLVQRQPASAEQRLQDVVQKHPSRLDAYEMLGQIYLQQGQLDRALAEYKSLSERMPQAVGPATMIAMIRQQKGDREGARAEYERVLQIDPRAGVAANNLAWMNAEDGRLEDAIRLATVAADVLRDRPEAQDTLGWVYLRKELPVHAVPALERAVELAPANPLYHQHLGQAYAKAGKSARARAELQRSIALGLGDRDAAQAREMLASLK
jgi:tetratricopeptide (TPR) repeat protein